MHAAARMQNGTGVYGSSGLPSTSRDEASGEDIHTSPSRDSGRTQPSLPGIGGINLDDEAPLDRATLKKRRARFWGKFTLHPPADDDLDKGKGKELPFQSKALEQQHWLEMVDHKVGGVCAELIKRADAQHRYGQSE